MSKQVRVRFAPSPTGPLHIGGVRIIQLFVCQKKQWGFLPKN
jgi:glutamyl/glutaminyl-tRNA synthetase